MVPSRDLLENAGPRLNEPSGRSRIRPRCLRKRRQKLDNLLVRNRLHCQIVSACGDRMRWDARYGERLRGVSNSPKSGTAYVDLTDAAVTVRLRPWELRQVNCPARAAMDFEPRRDLNAERILAELDLPVGIGRCRQILE